MATRRACWRDLLERAPAICRRSEDFDVDVREPGDVAARPREATRLNPLPTGSEHPRRTRSGACAVSRREGGRRLGRGDCEDDVRGGRRKPAPWRMPCNRPASPAAWAILDPDVAGRRASPPRRAPSRNAGVSQPSARASLAAERREERRGRQHCRGLRVRRQRPRRRRAAEQRDELAASHSITSSARASSLSGTGGQGLWRSCG